MTKGIVIYYQEYKEHDAIIHILGEDQVYSCVCKGVLKINSKNKSAIQLFTYSDFEFVDNQRSMKTLKHATIIHAFIDIRKDLLKQACALYLCECMDKSNVIAFELLHQTLMHLEKEVYSTMSLFQAKLNELVGVKAYVDGCVKCNAKNVIALSLDDGGFVCRNCNKTNYDDVSFLKQFRIYSKAKLNHFDLLIQSYPADVKLFQMFYSFFKEYAGINIKSYQFLKMLMDEM